MRKILILLFISLFFSCQTIENKNENPNIVLIVADDLGWNDLSYMGSKYYETPNIDKLSRSGMTFYNGYASAANCAPSRATMLSGRYNTHHGIYTVGASERGNKKTRKIIPIRNETILDLRYFLIPEMLKNEGYVTGHFGKWHLGSQGFFPEDNGFDINVGGNKSGGPGGYFSPYVNPNLEDGPIGEYLTDRIGNEVVSFINYNQNETFFAYVPFYSVHTPIQSKKEYQEDVLKLSSTTTINRALRSMQQVARDIENAKVSQVIYPFMQIVDIKHLKLDAVQSGIEQRKIHMLGSETLSNIDYKTPMFIHTPLINSLKGPGSKMSSSEVNSFISIRDSDEAIKKKINKAHCITGEKKENPILEITKLIIFPRIKTFIIDRDKKFGGNLKFKTYEELEENFDSKKIHPLDLKNTIAKYLIEIITPIRKAYK